MVGTPKWTTEAVLFIKDERHSRLSTKQMFAVFMARYPTFNINGRHIKESAIRYVREELGRRTRYNQFFDPFECEFILSRKHSGMADAEILEEFQATFPNHDWPREASFSRIWGIEFVWTKYELLADPADRSLPPGSSSPVPNVHHGSGSIPNQTVSPKISKIPGTQLRYAREEVGESSRTRLMRGPSSLNKGDPVNLGFSYSSPYPPRIPHFPALAPVSQFGPSEGAFERPEKLFKEAIEHPDELEPEKWAAIQGFLRPSNPAYLPDDSTQPQQYDVNPMGYYYEPGPSLGSYINPSSFNTNQSAPGPKHTYPPLPTSTPATATPAVAHDDIDWQSLTNLYSDDTPPEDKGKGKDKAVEPPDESLIDPALLQLDAIQGFAPGISTHDNRHEPAHNDDDADSLDADWFERHIAQSSSPFSEAETET